MRRCSSFSPCGRRWRETPDEGSPPQIQSLHAETDPSSVSPPLRGVDPPSPTRGEGKKSAHLSRRHCERSEAIHVSTCRAMDCFASLAMTTGWIGRVSRMVGTLRFRRRSSSYGGQVAHPTHPLPLPARTHAPAAPASETSRTASANSPAGSSASPPCASVRIRG
jgi:hypothetical protein